MNSTVTHMTAKSSCHQHWVFYAPNVGLEKLIHFVFGFEVQLKGVLITTGAD